jgi:transposase
MAVHKAHWKRLSWSNKQTKPNALNDLAPLFRDMYSHTGRPSIPPEQLLRASLLQVLYSIRNERMLVEQLDYNLLFRWFVGLSIDDKVWNHSTFSKHRERLMQFEVATAFFQATKGLAERAGLMSKDHFTVDGTLIEAWASMKSFRPKEDQDQDRPQRVVAIPRSISKGRSVRTIRISPPPTRMPACSKRAKARSPNSASWDTP